MKKAMKLSLSCALVAGMSGFAQGAITVDWYRTAAPNAFGSASYGQFWANVQDSIINFGGADLGTGNSAFTNVTEVTGMQSYVTTFESYNGVFEANEYGTRPSWAYYISNGGAVMDNSLLASATKNYSYSWDGTHTQLLEDVAPNGDIPFIPGGQFDANRLVGVRADGSIGTSLTDEYVGFIGLSGIAWTPWNWTGTLGVDHVYTTPIDASDPDRFDKLAQLAAFTGVTQDYWAFSINFGGQDFFAPNINVTPTPGSAVLLGLGGLMATRRRR